MVNRFTDRAAGLPGWHYATARERERRADSAYYAFARLVPYLERLFFLSCTPTEYSVPLMMW